MGIDVVHTLQMQTERSRNRPLERGRDVVEVPERNSSIASTALLPGPGLLAALILGRKRLPQMRLVAWLLMERLNEDIDVPPSTIDRLESVFDDVAVASFDFILENGGSAASFLVCNSSLGNVEDVAWRDCTDFVDARASWRRSTVSSSFECDLAPLARALGAAAGCDIHRSAAHSAPSPPPSPRPALQTAPPSSKSFSQLLEPTLAGLARHRGRPRQAATPQHPQHY